MDLEVMSIVMAVECKDAWFDVSISHIHSILLHQKNKQWELVLLLRWCWVQQWHIFEIIFKMLPKNTTELKSEYFYDRSTNHSFKIIATD